MTVRDPQRALAIGLALALAACGGTSVPPGNVDDSGTPDSGTPDSGTPDSGTPDGGPVGDNHAPTAAFTATPTGQALAPISFDGSASSDPDGDALSYSWDFGDGERGGNASLSHIFSLAGSFTVKLTVADGRGGVASVTHAVTIAAVTHGAAVVVTGLISDVNGPVSGVLVQDVNGASANTDAAGKVTLSLTIGTAHTLKLSKTGYGDQYQPVNLDAAATLGFFRAVLIAREAAANLDSTAGGSLTGKDGAKITLPAGALQDANGAAVTGTIQISQSPVDVTGKMVAAFPGKFAGIAADGTSGAIASYGTTEFSLSKNSQRLQLAPGKTATVELPIYVTQHLDGSAIAAGDKVPLWSLSEKTGIWTQEGQGTVVASSGSPTGFSLQSQVSHFSWWNGDHFIGGAYNPKPHCFLNPGPEFTPIPIPCTIGPPLPGEFQSNNPSPIRAGLTTTVSDPVYQVRADIPLNGGVAVIVPANVDFTLDGCAVSANVVYCGSKIVHGAAGASDEVVILLNPIAPAGTCGTPTALTLPVSQTFSIAAAGQAGCLHFTGAANQVLIVSIAPAVGSQLAGTLQLTGPDGAVLGTTSFAPGTSGVVTASTTAAGDYGVKVGASSGAPGAYQLAISSSAPQVAVPSTAVYQVDSVTGNKRFIFPAAAGDVIAVTVRTSGANGGSPGTITSLTDGTTSNFSFFSYGQLTFRPTVAGAYGFDVHSTQTNGTAVFVSIAKASTMAIGDLVTGSSNVDGSLTSFNFPATSGQLISAVSYSNDVKSGVSCPAQIRVFDPANQEVAPLSGGSASYFLGPAPLTTTGSYRLDLSNQFVGSGCPDVSARVSLVATPTALANAAPSTSATDTLQGIGDHRYYSVPLNAGDVVELVLHTADPLGATVELLPPDTTPFYKRVNVISVATEAGPSVGLNLKDRATVPYFVPVSGTYIVHITHQGRLLSNATGGFTWTLLQPAAVSLSSTSLLHDSITVPFQFARYTITQAAPGERLLYSELAGGVNPPVFRQLRDSTGALVPNLISNNIAPHENTVHLEAGTYTYEVISEQTDPFSYDAIAPIINDPIPMALGDTKNGTIGVIGGRGYYSFTAVAGQSYTLTTSGAVTGIAFAFPLIPGGDFTDTNNANFEGAGTAIGTPVSFTPSTGAAGTWIIEIDGTGTSTGAYSLTLH